MSEHDLLIRHAVKWAESRNLSLDRDILETVLDLRDFHDEERPQAWPSGSAEHLMLVRWPSHGPPEVPQSERLVATLETFWKFLRGCGRMATGSADPKSLTREARRAAPRMAEACADPAYHGASKTLMEFGRSVGISLDDAHSLEEAQCKLDQVVEAWNSLPVEERQHLSPGPSAHQGSAPGQRASDLAQALAMGAFDGFDVPDTDRDWRPEADDEMMPRKDPAVVSRQVQQSPFVQQVLRLANWVGQGRAVTATGVLRLAEARAAYEDLGLRSFQASLRSREQWGWTGPDGEFVPEPEIALDKMRSAGDLRGLDRLWQAAVTARLVDVGRTKARQLPVQRRNNEEWVHLGMVTLTILYLSLPRWSGQDQVALGALLMLLAHGRVSIAQLQEWWWDNEANHFSSRNLGGLGEEAEASLRVVSDRVVTRVLTEFGDAGVWRQDRDTLEQTDLGYELALLLANLEDRGLLDVDG